MLQRQVVDELKMPLTFDILSSGDILWKLGSAARTIEYSKNGGEWTSITATSEGTAIPVVEGDEVKFRGNIANGTGGSRAFSYFGSTCTFAARGNFLSLSYGENPDGNVPRSSYGYLFQNCAGLVRAPAMPKQINAPYAYAGMFSGCSALVETPDLSELVLITGLELDSMFLNCTSLIYASDLPGGTLPTQCCTSMFSGCSALKKAPKLPATTLLGNLNYQRMFYNCSALEDAPELPAAILTSSCYQNMFYGCSALKKAPELPAATLIQSCYVSMFNRCSELSEVRCLATDISASYALGNWLSGVAANGTFYKKAGVTWPSGASGIPSGWTIVEV